MEKARTIEEMINRLKMCTGDYCYLDVMRSSDIPESEFERFYHWNDEKYTRNLLERNDKFELVLICWEKGQRSFIHDYKAHDAWIHPIKGLLREERFVKDETSGSLEQVCSVVLDPNSYSFMGDSVAVHRFSNVYESRSVSLHLYAKPVDEWTTYTTAGEAQLTKVWWDSVREQKTADVN